MKLVEKRFTKKNGKPFVVVILEDFTGQIEITAWDDVFTKHQELLVPGAVVAVATRLTCRDDTVRATASGFYPLKPKASVKPVRLRLAREKLSADVLPDILETVKRFPGKRPLMIEIVNDDGISIEFRASDRLAVGDETGLQAAVLPFAAAKSVAA